MERVKGLATASKELEELQEIARIATRAALEEYERIPADYEKRLTLGTFFDGDDRVFELYIAGERPADAVVISSARVNRKKQERECRYFKSEKESEYVTVALKISVSKCCTYRRCTIGPHVRNL